MINLIEQLNNVLARERMFDQFYKDIPPTPQLPVIFIVGLPRSGTTPLAQMMIQRFRLGYASNLIAKFWNAPEFGISLARELSQDPGHESSGLESNYGFTAGYEGHHEFGYFWRRWFDFKENHFLDHEAQSRIDVRGLQKSLAVMENAWKRPLIFKNPAALPLQTEFLANMLSTSFFIYIKRDIESVAVSLFNGRIKYMKDINQWFSIKPKQYSHLKSQDIPEQIAGQIHYTQKELDRQMEMVPAHRKHCLSFSDLCLNPNEELSQIGETIGNAYPGLEDRTVGFPPLCPVAESMDSGLLHQIQVCLYRLAEQETCP
ncbi:sulfotransferase [Desulfonatronovibrio hydrogenovorans]|uniref:sulfotransferase n=1 Tax=Desulfonatronovibrio hydrogenovorans TaxID=53245 RepID=UPI00048AB23D|nr:sulfotransferase [Desulfonatronovibrio hydrogenovorans]